MTGSEPGSAAVLAAESIGKRFGSHQVLKSASLYATPGRVTAVMGRNGSGKSTLLDIAAGWRAADQGVVRFGPLRRARPRLHELAREGLFYLPQRPPLSANFRVRRFFQAVVRRYGGSPRPAVELLRLDDLMDRHPPSLSGGEKARVAVGLALTRRPVCLLADEPFAGVAPLDQELIAEALREAARQGVALVVTGHDVPVLFHLAHDVTWVVAGTTRHLGPPARAAADHHFRRDYLGPVGSWLPAQPADPTPGAPPRRDTGPPLD